jgi:hypothetical protein
VGDIIAYDWTDEDGKVNVNYLELVVGTEDVNANTWWGELASKGT